MSELPVYNTNSEARRRHHNNNETKTNTQTTEQSNFSEGSGGDLNYYSFQQFGNFSSLITPASNIWNAAQVYNLFLILFVLVFHSIICWTNN
uniref:Uncharacterized protein n=1 Tax=Meloidogyne enterolobii TaxID=390850 RepID=A0A6V7U4N3_MELEN|nr:unnamed protein product [Meloidogyne enterolobii]